MCRPEVTHIAGIGLLCRNCRLLPESTGYADYAALELLGNPYCYHTIEAHDLPIFLVLMINIVVRKCRDECALFARVSGLINHDIFALVNVGSGGHKPGR